MDEVLDPFEKVIWRGKPDKKAFVLWAFGGIPFALFFLAGILFFVNLGVPIFESLSPISILFPIFIIGLIVVPPIWQYRKYPKTEYMITNQRLLIKEGITEDDLWFVKLGKIKEIIVRKGIIGKLLGTGKIYPITDEYPYAPKIYSYSGEYSRGGLETKKVFNIVRGEYEEITERELAIKTSSHPHLDATKKPHAVKKILEEAIFGAGTNYINCRYCYYRFDVNKLGKCPHCGAPQT